MDLWEPRCAPGVALRPRRGPCSGERQAQEPMDIAAWGHPGWGHLAHSLACTRDSLQAATAPAWVALSYTMQPLLARRIDYASQERRMTPPEPSWEQRHTPQAGGRLVLRSTCAETSAHALADTRPPIRLGAGHRWEDQQSAPTSSHAHSPSALGPHCCSA